MSHRVATCRGGFLGFTLIEMLVCLVLASFLSLGVLESLRWAERSVSRVRADAEHAEAVATSQSVLRQLLEQMRPSEAGPLDADPDRAEPLLTFPLGRAEQLEFSAPAPRGYATTAATAAPLRYRLRAETGDDRQAMTLAVEVLSSSGATASAKSLLREVLVRDAASVRFAYRARSDAVVLSDASAEWQSTWSDPHRLPALIRVEVELNDSRRRWPPLIVAPRIDAPASCEFDAVSQDCRDVVR
jgi:general secretion pathway protein J